MGGGTYPPRNGSLPQQKQLLQPQLHERHCCYRRPHSNRRPPRKSPCQQRQYIKLLLNAHCRITALTAPAQYVLILHTAHRHGELLLLGTPRRHYSCRQILLPPDVLSVEKLKKVSKIPSVERERLPQHSPLISAKNIFLAISCPSDLWESVSFVRRKTGQKLHPSFNFSRERASRGSGMTGVTRQRHDRRMNKHP